MSVKVLVVDDSLFMRRLVSDMLSSDPEIELIDTAKDGHQALKKVLKTKPDVVTLDLVMAGWDGLTTLNHIMAECPTPVVILSAHSKEGADITIQCLNAGAVGFVLKPSGELSLDIHTVREQLLEEVKAASKVKAVKIKSLIAKKPERPYNRLISINRIIAIGASTGGPQTLEAIVSSFPYDLPAPIIIVQHLPSKYFTESLADHLNQNCELVVKVAENNEIIQAGRVYLAPGGFQMTVKPQWATEGAQKTTNVIICLYKDDTKDPTLSIDVTMKSVAQVYNGNAIGIILTGMGQDGVEGMKAIKGNGGKTIAQDETSLIFGMPKAVIDAGLADKVLPMSEIAGTTLELLRDMEKCRASQLESV